MAQYASCTSDSFSRYLICSKIW